MGRRVSVVACRALASATKRVALSFSAFLVTLGGCVSYTDQVGASCEGQATPAREVASGIHRESGGQRGTYQDCAQGFVCLTGRCKRIAGQQLGETCSPMDAVYACG